MEKSDSPQNIRKNCDKMVELDTKNEPQISVGELYKKDKPYYKQYDAIDKCRSAGIIPYTLHQKKLYFLLQKNYYPSKKKDLGWNDFGGKQNNENETTSEIASREFSEETSCLFYLKDQNTEEAQKLFDLLKNGNKCDYQETMEILKRIIPLSQKYYTDKINEFVIPIYISSKETYISYFIKVNYIPEFELPTSEDLHIDYEERYLRECKWFSLENILSMEEKEFHKRLQITKIQKRILNYEQKGLFC